MAIRRVPTQAGDEAWLVTGYDQVKALLADRRLGRGHPDPDNAPRFTSSVVLGKPHKATAQQEMEKHALMRRMLAPEFSAKRMESMRPRVRHLVNDLLDDLVRQGQPADFHEAVSFPLPVLVICELLGVPADDREEFRSWSEAMSTLNDEQKSMRGFTKLWAYMAELVAQKRKNPADDVISRMTREHPDAGEQEIAQLSAGLLFAGHETTVAAIDRAVMLLSLHPEQWQTMKDPDAVPAVVEEVLRHRAPLERRSDDSGMPRYAMADIEIEGTVVPAGDLVLLGIDQANRDPGRFPDPAAFVPRVPNPHLSFGHGFRFCVGAPLARVELAETLEALVTRFTAFGLAADPSTLSRRTEQLVGGVAQLPVRWTEA